MRENNANVRLGLRTLALLGFCAAALSAAVAHVAIDVVGDYLLPHDAYDAIAHTSRDFVTGVALLAGCALAWKTLRTCFELACANRRSAAPQIPGRKTLAAFAAFVAVAACAIVPAMEILDGRLDGVAIRELDDAFGGSILLGVMTTVACAAVIAGIAFALVRWLLSHRDSIVAILETLLRFLDGASQKARLRRSQRSKFVLQRTLFTLERPKRGPPDVALASLQRLIAYTLGDPHDRYLLTRSARAWCARARDVFGRARECGIPLSP